MPTTAASAETTRRLAEAWIELFFYVLGPLTIARKVNTLGSRNRAWFRSGGELDLLQFAERQTDSGWSNFSGSYIGMSLGSTPQQGAIDIDFMAWAPGFNQPQCLPEPSSFLFQGLLSLLVWSFRVSKNRAQLNHV